MDLQSKIFNATHSWTNFEIKKYYQIESKFNSYESEFYSRDNLP